MRPLRFLISSLALAGLLPPQVAHASTRADVQLEPSKERISLFQRFRLNHAFDLAGHSSHSSHSSHASHTSHQSHSSSSGGGYATPGLPSGGGGSLPGTGNDFATPSGSGQGSQGDARFLLQGDDEDAPPERTAPTAPIRLPGNTAKFNDIVIQLQTALYAYGYYAGPITGIVDAATKAAIADMQSQFGLPQTGAITPEVLDALGVAAV